MPKLFSDKLVIGNLAFNTDAADNDGVEWYCDMMDGWDETVAPTVELSVSEYADGAIASDFFATGPRYIEMEGVVVAPTRNLAIKAYRSLVTQIHPNVTRDYKRYGPFNELLRMRGSGALEKVSDIGHAFRFHTTLLAVWPYKTGIKSRTRECGAFTGLDYRVTYPRTYPRTYSESTGEGTGSSYVLFTNNGNADALPVVEVTGPLTANSWQVTNVATGESLSFATDLSAGQTLKIDNRERSATLDGADVDYYIRGDWLHLAPGAPSEFRLLTGVANPQARLKITMADTWR